MAEAKKVSRKAKSGEAKAEKDKTAKKDSATKFGGVKSKTITAPKKAVSKPTKKEDSKIVKKAEKLAIKEETSKIAEMVETESIAEVIVEAEKEIIKEEVIAAKAGKRSTKSLKEAEEKQAKASRKEAAKSGKAQAKTESKKPIKVRSKLERRGKNYRNAAKQYDINKEFTVKEACELAVKTNPVKFDASIEIHARLGVDPKQADQNIRSTIVLPAGTGKAVKVAVLAEDDKLESAKKAGADIAMSDDFFALLDKESIDFDVLIATPSMMPKLGKYARLLGPKGLMPNPKSGTVTTDTAKAVNEAKAGKVEYRVDQNGIVHVAIGKVSFGAQKINNNFSAVITSIKSAKPASVKGTYIKSVYLTTSMGPGIKIALSEL